MKIIAWVEDHPYESAGIIAGVLALILIISHYKNAASAAASSATAGYGTASDPSLYAAETSAYEQQQSLASQASQYATGAQTAQNIATLQANTSTTNTTTAAQVATAGVSAQEAVQLAGIQSNNTIAQIQASLEGQIASLQTGVQTQQIAASSTTEQSLISALTPTQPTGQGAANANWVIDEYQNVLGRAPSASEVSYYTNLEANGTSENTIDQYFHNSPEYKKLIGATS